MKRIIFCILLITTLPAHANDDFGGYGNLLEKINRDASHHDSKQNAVEALKSVPVKYVSMFSEYAYKKFLKSQSQSDYTGILSIISPVMLSAVVERVMLTVSFGYDYLDHEFYLSNTPGVEFETPSSVYKKVFNEVKDPCELSVWNAIFKGKGHNNLRYETNCTIINKLVESKSTFSKSEMVNIYYKFRDIDGY